MMDRIAWRDEIGGIEVFDTHTHLDLGEVSAQSFWDVAHYFWFIRELQAAGYPTEQQAMAMPEKERIAVFCRALGKIKNTSWSWAVRRMFKDLYDIAIGDEKSVGEADEAIRSSAANDQWPAMVCRKAAIKRIVVNKETDRFKSIAGKKLFMPRIESEINSWRERIAGAKNRLEAADGVSREIGRKAAQWAGAGIPGIMAGSFSNLGGPAGSCAEKALESAGRELTFVLHRLCREAEANNLVMQLFLGVEDFHMARNRTERLPNLYGVFETYNCRFDLVIAAELSNTDAVNAARCFPNVHLGGLWWYAFRSSIYRQSMQQRIEALPPGKSALVASDARHIEWSYCKLALVKTLMADFLFDQIQQGWIDREVAVWVARNWLHDAAAGLYHKAGDRS